MWNISNFDRYKLKEHGTVWQTGTSNPISMYELTRVPRVANLPARAGFEVREGASIFNLSINWKGPEVLQCQIK
jgi:hypothetical protein